MKKTTYIMLGAIVLGLVAVMIIASSFSRSLIVEVENITLGGDYVEIPLETAGKIRFNDFKKYNGRTVKNYKGIAVLESDTARSVSLRTRADWVPALKCDTEDDVLTVTVDYDSLVSTYMGADYESDKRHNKCLSFTSEDFCIATVIMPCGMLSEVRADRGTMYVDSVRAEKLISRVNYRLVLNDCNINQLVSRANRMDELKLDSSVVKLAELKAVDGNFRVTCTNDDSSIGVLAIDGVYGKKKRKSVNLMFEKANIGDFKWNPTDTVTQIIMKVNPRNKKL